MHTGAATNSVDDYIVLNYRASPPVPNFGMTVYEYVRHFDGYHIMLHVYASVYERSRAVTVMVDGNSAYLHFPIGNIGIQELEEQVAKIIPTLQSMKIKVSS